MTPPAPRQLALYVAVALVVLAVGWRYAAGPAGDDTAPPAGPPPPSASVRAPAGAAGPPVVVVHVTGAVRRPGVYRLPDGSRVEDAVRRAGPRPGAVLGGVNLAARLADGEQIAVPGRAGGGVVAAAPGAGVDGGPVHLNSATLEQLETLEGIGPALAQRILDYRVDHGGFRAVEELDEVSGIGPARLAALQGDVAL